MYTGSGSRSFSSVYWPGEENPILRSASSSNPFLNIRISIPTPGNPNFICIGARPRHAIKDSLEQLCLEEGRRLLEVLQPYYFVYQQILFTEDQDVLPGEEFQPFFQAKAHRFDFIKDLPFRHLVLRFDGYRGIFSSIFNQHQATVRF